MYQNILKQIANTIFINIQHQEGFGLLNGKTGTTLFLYNYARYTNNEIYSNLADELVDQIYENLNRHADKCFFNGLAGITYGVDYIIKNKNVEVDESDGDGDILEEIDSELSQMNEEDFLLDLESDLPLFSKGLYFLQRRDKYSLSKMTEECLAFLIRNEQKIPLSYANSILFFINKTSELEDVDRSTFTKISDILYDQTSDILSKGDYSKSDIYTFNLNIRDIQKSEIKEKWVKLLAKYTYENISLLEKSWIHFVYKYNIEESVDEPNIQKMLENTTQDLTHEELNLYNGLAGLGLELIRLSKEQ